MTDKKDDPTIFVDLSHRPRHPLLYEPHFEFNPDTQSYETLAPSAATVAQDIHAAFARDIEGKMRQALIGLGWAPPERAADLERVLRRLASAACDVERDSALIEARHVLSLEGKSNA